MIIATFPKRFIYDCFECDCDVGEIDRDNSKGVTLRMTPAQAGELQSRAEHYAGPDGPDGPGLIGLKLSARRCLELLRAARERANERDEVERRGSAGGVADMEALARLRPDGRASRDFTSADTLTVTHLPSWSPPWVYKHNGVRIERDRAVELIGERL